MLTNLLLAIVIGLQLAVIVMEGCNFVAINNLEDRLYEKDHMEE